MLLFQAVKCGADNLFTDHIIVTANLQNLMVLDDDTYSAGLLRSLPLYDPNTVTATISEICHFHIAQIQLQHTFFRFFQN